jgi:trehalose-6-phosphate synthase
MNLVAKEFCAAQTDELGVLVLSEFAGAAAELQTGALLINPYDAEGVMESIVRACKMHPEERRARMRRMREVVRINSVFVWCRNFYRAAKARTEPVPTTAARETANLISIVPSSSAWKQAAGSFG